jgi:BlaI family penicillinase repressor
MEEIKQLTNREMQIMDILWNIQEGTVNDILDKWLEPKPAYTTMGTFMKILQKKGFVVTQKTQGSKTLIFVPTITRQEYTRQEMKHVKNRFFDGSLKSLISFLVKDEEMTDDDIRELVKIINEAEK